MCKIHTFQVSVFCFAVCASSAHVGQVRRPNCSVTVGGPDPGQPCALPFTFRGVRHLECTNVVDPLKKFWCSTKTNASGFHVSKLDKWGYCDPGCNFGGVNWPSDEPRMTIPETDFQLDVDNDESALGTWLPDPANGECGRSTSTGYIVGGNHSRTGEFPFLAAIGYRNSKADEDSDLPKYLFNCGGMLINRRYILTAAHCHEEQHEQLRIAKVMLGSSDFSSAAAGSSTMAAGLQQFQISNEDVTLHEEWQGSSSISIGNDIALVRLPRLVTTIVQDPVDQHVLPICLPTILPDQELLQNHRQHHQVLVLGFGRTNNNDGDQGDAGNSGFFQPLLQKAPVSPFPFDRCRRHYLGLNLSPSNHICAGGVKGE